MGPFHYLAGVACALLVLCVGGAQPLAAEMSDPLESVARLDLERYMGRWYEIAKIPNRFQRKCAGDTTATYTLRPDGDVTVVNRCVRTDGREILTRGLAKVVDKDTAARLKVSFVSLVGIRLFWGKYWVIGLDPGYEWAVVGEPKRKYGWILAREPELTLEQWEEVRLILRDRGYDPTRFVVTSHSEAESRTRD